MMVAPSPSSPVDRIDRNQLIEDLGKSSYLNAIRQLYSDTGFCGRTPLERLSIPIGNQSQLTIRNAFWIFVESGGSTSVKLALKPNFDNSNDAYNFTLPTNRLIPCYFEEGIINIPTGLAGTMVLWIAHYPIPIPNLPNISILDSTGAAITNANPFPVSVQSVPANQSENIAQVGGTAVTGRDWTVRFDQLQGLPIAQETSSVGGRLKASVTTLGLLGDQTSVLLGVNATATGTIRTTFMSAASLAITTANTQGMTAYRTAGVFAISAQAGTINFLLSFDGVTFDVVRAIPTAANTAVQASQDTLGAAESRTDYVNGGVAQTSFRFSSGGVS